MPNTAKEICSWDKKILSLSKNSKHFLSFGPRCCSTLCLFRLSNFCIWASLVDLVWIKCTSGVLKFSTCCLLLAVVRVFLCQLYSPIYLYCSPVVLSCHLNVIFHMAIKGEVWHATKPGSTRHFVL